MPNYKLRFFIVICILFHPLFFIHSNDIYTKFESQFAQNGTSKMLTGIYTYSDSYFDKAPSIFNIELARLSFGLAESYKHSQNCTLNHRKDQVISFLRKCGFENIIQDDLDVLPDQDTIGSSIASKKIKDYTLIVIAPRGSRYSKEWMSNLTVGTGDRHEGFSKAAQKIEKRFEDYIESNNITGKIKIWICGFSRGAAIANLIAADLTMADKYDSVFCYTMGTPAVSKKIEKNLTNIFNIVGRNDPVTAVPLKDWGFKRYGITYYTPAQEYDSDYLEKLSSAASIYKSLTGNDFVNNPEINEQFRQIIERLYKILPEPEDYVNLMQEDAVNAFKNKNVDDFLSIILNLIKKIDNIDEERMNYIDSLSDYISVLLYQYASGNISQVMRGEWNENISFAANLINEHSPEVYYSWLYSKDNADELFSPAHKKTLRLVLFETSSSDAVIKISDDKGFVQSFDFYGSQFDENNNELIHTMDNTPLYYFSRNGQVILSIPKDKEYYMTIISSDNLQLEYYGIEYGIDSLEGTSGDYCTLNMEADKEYKITSYVFPEYGYDGDKNQISTFGKNKYEEILIRHELEIFDNSRITITKVTGIFLILIISITILLFSFIINSIVLIVKKQLKKKWITFFLQMVLAEVVFAISEISLYYFAGVQLLYRLFGIICSMSFIFIAFEGLLQNKKTRNLIMIFLVIFLSLLNPAYNFDIYNDTINYLSYGNPFMIQLIISIFAVAVISMIICFIWIPTKIKKQ